MSPDELRAVAGRVYDNPQFVDVLDSLVIYKALLRLADVIEYAEQVGIVRRATVLDLARGETNDEHT